MKKAVLSTIIKIRKLGSTVDSKRWESRQKITLQDTLKEDLQDARIVIRWRRLFAHEQKELDLSRLRLSGYNQQHLWEMTSRLTAWVQATVSVASRNRLLHVNSELKRRQQLFPCDDPKRHTTEMTEDKQRLLSRSDIESIAWEFVAWV